jgi:DnaJ-class molecular chaperone
LHEKFKELALQHHPDRGRGSNLAKFQAITESYAVLKDSKRRKQYDDWLKLTGRQCASCKGQGVTVQTVGFNGRTKRVVCKVCQGTGARQTENE